MRGEETQIVGAIDHEAAACSRCFPGTHSKWARVERGRLVDFATFMTGELYARAARAQHPRPARRARDAGTATTTRSRAASRAASAPAGCAHDLFGARTLCAAGRARRRTSVADWLSGLLIGREIRTRAKLGVPRAATTRRTSASSATTRSPARYVTALGRRRHRRDARTGRRRRPRPVADRPAAGLDRDPRRTEMAPMNAFSAFLRPLPLIAVLRGITPEEIPDVAGALFDAGFRILEVPLNSPRAFASIALLAQRHGHDCLVGAGTVVDVGDVARVRDAGGRLIVMPHADTAVVRAAKAAGMVCAPGVATPTEAFAAIAAGADGLKMFPAEALPPAALKAWRAVLPTEIPGVRRRRHPARDHGRLLGARARRASAPDRTCTGRGPSSASVRAAPRRSRPRCARCRRRHERIRFARHRRPRRGDDRVQPGARRRARPTYLRASAATRRTWRSPRRGWARASGYVTRVGDDAFGRMLLDLWRAEGVDTTGVAIDAEAPTGVYFVTHGAHGPRVLVPARGLGGSAHGARRRCRSP